jgi:hypothetical protein
MLIASNHVPALMKIEIAKQKGNAKALFPQAVE